METFPRIPLSLSMAHVTPTLASLFRRRSAPAKWSKLEDDHELSRLRSKFWGKKIEEEAKERRELQPTVEVDRANDIGPECYGLDLGIELKRSELWVRQDYIRIYDYCSKRYEEGPSSVRKIARSVVITGQPGVGVFLSSVASCALSNNPSREKVNHIGSPTLCVVVSANGSHFFGIEVASASYLSMMECFNNTSRVSPPMTLRCSYGRSSMPMHEQLVFPNNSFRTQTSTLCSPPLRSEINGRL
jgi:hypothetical protein